MLTTVDIAKLQNCDRPLNEEERGEMSIERQWGALESMSLLQKAPNQEEKEENAALTVAESPKPPPPKAPLTYAADPGSQNCLGGEYSKGKDSKCDSKGKDPKGDSKGKDYKGDADG